MGLVVHNSFKNSLFRKSSIWFQQKNPMVQITSCEWALKEHFGANFHQKLNFKTNTAVFKKDSRIQH